jgi:hypothetical protein
MSDTTVLRERRLAIVREHMESENTHDLDDPQRVPRQRNENTILRVSDDAIIAEFDLLGTHRGELRGSRDWMQLPLSRLRDLRVPAGSDHIICERMYFDQARRSPSSGSATAAPRRESSHDDAKQ